MKHTLTRKQLLATAGHWENQYTYVNLQIAMDAFRRRYPIEVAMIERNFRRLGKSAFAKFLKAIA